ncbi:hypothetical protein JCM33374_g5464 [Metschnikowia sp. JCM 33374]|nr:hypothetical protein JCM33374_g5464 [Metschnikowia sp. JCM 33374]
MAKETNGRAAKAAATPVETAQQLPATSSAAPGGGGAASLSNLVSRYQTSIGIHSLLDSSSQEPVSIVDRPNSMGSAVSISEAVAKTNPTSTEKRDLRPLSTGPQDTISKHIKSFTPVIDLSDEPIMRVSPAKQSSAAKQTKFNRTSISSLINLDENVPLSEAPIKSTIQPEKRKRASPKSEGTSKKSKTDTQKRSSKSEPKNDPKKDLPSESNNAPERDSKADPKKDSKPDPKKDPKPDPKKDAKSEPKRTQKSDPKAETKKAAKAKKKTPELILPSQDKPSIHPTMTTEKSKNTGPAAVVPPPSFISMEESGPGELGIGGGGDEKEKPLVPVVVNVLKLAEEKYGWSAVHPEARSAFELMDDVLDDDEEGEDDEDEEVMIVDEKGNSLKKREDQDKKKKKQQSQQQQQSKVNRKVGKYDYEDPFIDDAELQWEEEITTTKEGFFVYWGPLVDERQPAKKGNAKGKK